MPRILLVDDHAVVRKGMRYILESSAHDFQIEEAATAAEALAKFRESSWDAMVLDISMPDKNGIDTLKQIKKEKPKLPVLILSMYPEDQYGVRVIKAGASGYVPKASAPEQLLEAVEKILSGKHYISPALAEDLATQVAESDERPKHTMLSNREYEILCSLASGKTVASIAQEFNLSVKTVYSYRTRLLRKMGMKNNAELTHYVFQHGLISS